MSEMAEDHYDGAHLALSIWHPECWTLQVTEGQPGGLFGHGVYPVDGAVKGRFTVYAGSEDELDALVDRIEASPHTKSVWQLDNRYHFDGAVPTPGNTSRRIVVMYGSEHSINEALVSNGFIPEKAVWIQDGRERWTVVIEEDRQLIQERLDSIRQEMDADIAVKHITADNSGGDGVLRRGILSERQREVFELAREMGYYRWPREVSATDIAEELGVSKATTLEHLRKAEAKVIDGLP